MAVPTTRFVRFLGDFYSGRFAGTVGGAFSTKGSSLSRLILLTNDDGIHAPGLAAMRQELLRLGEVHVIAPATEQSGVGHSITFLTPLICNEIFDGDQHSGWAVDGSPADCVRIAVSELMPRRPDVIVSGINGGLNAGINVLYSGTVAAAIEGAFFGITSFAVSLEYADRARFDVAAATARQLIEQILSHKGKASRLYNVNIPTVATECPAPVHVVPMGLNRYGEHFVKRTDPKGRDYYWTTADPPPEPTDFATDLSTLSNGHISVTPLEYDMTSRDEMSVMSDWELTVKSTNT